MPHTCRVYRIKIQRMGLNHLVMLMVRVRVMVRVKISVTSGICKK